MRTVTVQAEGEGLACRKVTSSQGFRLRARHEFSFAHRGSRKYYPVHGRQCFCGFARIVTFARKPLWLPESNVLLHRTDDKGSDQIDSIGMPPPLPGKKPNVLSVDFYLIVPVVGAIYVIEEVGQAELPVLLVTAGL